MSETLGAARGRRKLTVEEWKFLKDHLTVILDPDKDKVEIGWVTDCGDKSCGIPHCTIIFYSCPSKPCPS